MIQPIVEGYGDVAAVPLLLRRLATEGGISVEVGTPHRHPRSRLVQQTHLQSAVQVAIRQPDCRAVLILFDSDKDCPKELAPQVRAWAQNEAGPRAVAVVLPHKEYESWFLGSILSLRGQRGIRADAQGHPAPEEPRGVKSKLEERMRSGRSYGETTDQPAMTAIFDMAMAYRNCRSFRHLVLAFEQIVRSAMPERRWQRPGWVE